MDSHREGKGWGTDEEANTANQHTRIRVATVEQVSKMATGNRADAASDYDHDTCEQACKTGTQAKRVALLQVGRQECYGGSLGEEGEDLHYNQHDERLDAQQRSKLCKDTPGDGGHVRSICHLVE